MDVLVRGSVFDIFVLSNESCSYLCIVVCHGLSANFTIILQGAGIIMDILLPALFNLRCVLGPATVPSNIDLINSLAKHEQIDIWSMVPSLVDELGESPDVLEQVKRSKFICASGGEYTPVKLD